jgi:DegV family protein with EDD domain
MFYLSTDSGADLPLSYCKEHHVTVLPLGFCLEGVNYQGDGSMDCHEFYEKLRNGAMPTTSAANPEDTAKLFRSILSQGHDLLHIAFSSGLSSTSDAAFLAAKLVSEEFPERKLQVVDSLCASMGQGFLVHQAVLLRDAGNSLEETAQKLTDMRLNVVHNFTVDDLNHLHRGGRVSKATAVVGSLMGIKPVLHVDNEGHLTSVSKARGRKGSIQALADRMATQIPGFDNPTVFISHGDCLSDAEYLADLIRQRFGISDILIGEIGPVIGTHSGPGTLALFFFGNPR